MPLAPPALSPRELVATIALLVGLFAACQDAPQPRPPLPPYRPNTTCAAACAHRLALGCTDGKPTAKGTSCEDVCLDVNASGVARWPTDCLVVTRTCADEGVCR